MVSPTFLVPRLGRLSCPNCKRTPWNSVTIVGQAILLVKGADFLPEFAAPTPESAAQRADDDEAGP